MNSVACNLIVICAVLTAGLVVIATTTQEQEANTAAPVNERNALCPFMFRHVFESATPRDEAKAGTFEEYIPAAGTVENGEVDLYACLAACCEKERNNTCNVVFVFKRKCYHIRCVTNEACLPKQRPEVRDRLQMILVNPVHVTDDDNVTWLDVLKLSKSGVDLDELNTENTNPLSFWKQSHKFHYPGKSQVESSTYEDDELPPMTEKHLKQLFMPLANGGDPSLMDDMAFYSRNLPTDPAAMMKHVGCELEVSESNNRCTAKEECVPLHANSLNGICKCIPGYVRNQLRECVPQALDYQTLFDDSSIRNSINLVDSEALRVNEEKSNDDMQRLLTTTVGNELSKKLLVTVDSKEVRLPEKEVTLAAFTVPDEQSTNTTYKYLWTLITQPKGPMINGTISDQSKPKVKLSNLSVGLYTFKVSVTGNNAYGEATANVTVLPEKRMNRVPQVVITPTEQTIRQPTTNAVLDGSMSTDDDKIVGWHWEVVSGPIGYQPKLSDVSTLQLTDLTSPGNYTFKLTVIDSDNITNSTTATVTVLKETDYPPVANAGDAVILYLPNNNVTLNGTASSDDHEIVAWEWTKDAGDESKAVDMQNTRTPYVQLSNLEEGMYTFALKVTDGSGQSSTAKVHVFVKPPTNTPPVAVAGKNATVNLPQNWVLLNGSLSSDDIHIQSFSWSEVTGPNTASIRNATSAVANATSLTLGVYEFKLTVVDDNGNNASDSTWVKIIQEKNAAPVANAGGDKTVILPCSALYLNGSNSSDDLAVAKYAWTREEMSLAAGLIIGDTNNESVLILSNLVPGQFVFKLTVSDDQGLTSSDTVNVIVHQDPMLMNLVEITLPMSVSVLTQAELDSVVQKIGLLLGDKHIRVRDLKTDYRSQATILVFYAEAKIVDGKTSVVDGLAVEQLLKDKLQRDASILDTVFVDVRTTVCQNNCSGHGVCNEVTRACICESFWMPSGGYFWGFSYANCDWSILYVFVGIIVGLLILIGLFWGIVCACKQTTAKKSRSRPKIQKYALIGTRDEEAPHFGRASSLTDSETDSDVLFETRTKPNGNARINGASRSKGPRKYASSKARKVKT